MRTRRSLENHGFLRDCEATLELFAGGAGGSFVAETASSKWYEFKDEQGEDKFLMLDCDHYCVAGRE